MIKGTSQKIVKWYSTTEPEVSVNSFFWKMFAQKQCRMIFMIKDEFLDEKDWNETKNPYDPYVFYVGFSNN